jgi:hypothetical protein
MMGDEEARPPESGTPPPRGVVAGLMLPGHMLLGGPVAVVAAEWVIVDSWEVLVARPVRAPVVAAGVVAAGVVAAGVVAAGVVAAGVVAAHATPAQARTLNATRASAAAARLQPFVQGRSAVATSRAVLPSGISTTVRGSCARRTRERYPESWHCLFFGGTTGRYGRDGNFAAPERP